MPKKPSVIHSFSVALCILACSNGLAATYVSTSPAPTLLQFTESQGRILGHWETTSFPSVNRKQVFQFDIDGFRNAGEISLRFISANGHVDNAFGTVNGKRLTLRLQGQLWELHVGTLTEYQKAVDTLQSRATAESHALEIAAQKAQAQTNAVAHQHDLAVEAQSRAVEPSYKLAKDLNANLEANLDRILALLQQLPGGQDLPQLTRTLSVFRDNTNNCDAYRNFDRAGVDMSIQDDTAVLPKLQLNIDDLKSRIEATRSAIAAANNLIKNNPLAPYTPLSFEHSEAPTALKYLIQAKASYENSIQPMTAMLNEFNEIRKTSNCNGR